MSGTEDDTKRGLRHVWVFMAVVAVCSFVTWWLMDGANKRLRESHDLIIAQHKNAICSSDSLLLAINAVSADSLPHDRARLINQLCGELSRSIQAVDTRNDVSSVGSMLETEFTKIQHEYEVLNLWCALLTIVFLIFSFFSIFKANEMANQSEVMLDKMRNIATDIHKKSEDIDAEITTNKAKIGEISNSIISIETNKNALSSEINTLKDNDVAALKNSIRELTKKITELEAKRQEIDTRIEAIWEDHSTRLSQQSEGILDRLKIELVDNVKEEFENSNKSVSDFIEDQHTKNLHFNNMLDEINRRLEAMNTTPVDATGHEEIDIDDLEDGVNDSDEETSNGVTEPENQTL